MIDEIPTAVSSDGNAALSALWEDAPPQTGI